MVEEIREIVFDIIMRIYAEVDARLRLGAIDEHAGSSGWDKMGWRRDLRRGASLRFRKQRIRPYISYFLDYKSVSSNSDIVERIIIRHACIDAWVRIKLTCVEERNMLGGYIQKENPDHLPKYVRNAVNQITCQVLNFVQFYELEEQQ